VLGRGRIPAPILFIGEGPGVSEDTLGLPFVGPAGKLLDGIIEEATDPWDGPIPSYFITNLVACMPTDEEGNKVHTPPPFAIKKCVPRLEEVFALVRPQIVIMVGSLSEKWVPKHFGYKDAKEFIGIVHPAWILRAQEPQRSFAYQQSVVRVRDAFELV